MNFVRHVIAAAAAAALLFSFPAKAQEAYGVRIDGAPEDLREKLETISDLKRGLRDYPTRAALRRAAERDAAEFRTALSASGYYAGAVEVDLVQETQDGPVNAVFTVTTGPAFRITAYEIVYQDAGEGRPATLAEAGVETSGSADGAALRARQTEFLTYLLENGYPNAQIVTRRAIANFETGEASAVFVFASGPKARFGDIRIEGLEKTEPSYLRRLRTWEDGETFDRSKLISYRDRLAKTGLFSTIDVSAGAGDETGAAPIIIDVSERRRRSIGAGASFSTDEGPGGRLFFEHRNIFGRGENLRIELSGSEIEQSINFDAARPLPRLPGRAFGNFEFSNETTDAFDARSVSVAGGLAKLWLDDRLETRAALALETSNIRASGEEERTYFVSTPLSVLWDSEDDLLNPTKGVRAALTVTPYTGTDSFVQSALSARSRVLIGKDDRFTLAGRAVLGATFGNSLEGLPRNKRYFAGGGGSVRGFGFQEVGPLDDENDPIGGRSLIEAAAEARARISQNIQLAAFIDTGSVSASAFPDFREDFFIGYGGGIRYFTPIGPIRADVAFPMDKREGDRGFQIYIALGQPF